MFEDIGWGWGIIWGLVAYLAASFRIVKGNELAIIFRLGEPVREVGSGPKIVPLGFYTRKLFPSTAIQLELPGEPEEVQKEDEGNVRPGRKVPIRIAQAAAESAIFYTPEGTRKTFSEFSPEEKELIKADLLNERITSEPVILIRWRLVRGQLIKFYQNVGSVEEASRQLADAAIASLNEELTQITVGHTLKTLNMVSRRVRSHIEIFIGEKAEPGGGIRSAPWGIDLRDVQIKDVDPGETVNRAMAEAAAAIKEREKTVQDAKAEGEARRLVAAGEADGIKAMVVATKGDDGRFVAGLRAATEISKKADFIIVPDALGLVAGAQKLLSAMK